LDHKGNGKHEKKGAKKISHGIIGEVEEFFFVLKEVKEFFSFFVEELWRLRSHI